MSAQKPFTPEERASFLGWRFGSTLDWASIILAEIGYPVEENRWFVDAACGIYQRTKHHYPEQGVPISHSALAKRAGKFKNKAQASELARRALNRDADWSRLKRTLVFDVERPKPQERRGKDKRAATKYTDYLTPAAVWAQGCEQAIKKADPAAWKSSKYRGEKRAEILAEAVGMLPQFKGAAEEDLPVGMREQKCAACGATDCAGHSLPLRDYVEQRQNVEAAERRRIIGKIEGNGQLTDTDEIDTRLALLDTYYSRSKAQLERDYASARAVLLGMRSTRLVTPARFTDPEEIAAEVDEKLRTEAGKDGPADWLQDSLFLHKKGNAGVTLLVQPDAPSPTPSSSGSNSYKGGVEVSR
jgi:hypothetical protein